MKKITTLLILLALIVPGVFACAPTVPQEEYDRLSLELSNLQSQLASLQDEATEAEMLKFQYEELKKRYDTVKSQYDTLQAKYEPLVSDSEELNERYDTVKSQYDSLLGEYEELTTAYEELIKEYEATIEEPAEPVTEEGIEQAIFKLVNQERESQELDELMWGPYIYKYARSNSRDMANKDKRIYSDYGAYQQIFWATGYDSTDSIANAAMTIWQNETRYDIVFLNPVMRYGAVAVHQANEIYYITFISDYYK